MRATTLTRPLTLPDMLVPSFGLLLLASFVVRAVFAYPYLMIGDDTLSYLDSMRALSGNGTPGWEGHAVGGVFLWPFAQIWGDLQGARFAALTASVIPAVPFYILARRVAPAWPAMLGAVTFIWVPAYGSVLGWGFMTLLSISVAMLAFECAMRLYETDEIKWAWRVYLLTLMLLFMNQTALLVFAPAMLIMHALLARKKTILFPLAMWVAAILAIVSGGLLGLLAGISMQPAWWWLIGAVFVAAGLFAAVKMRNVAGVLVAVLVVVSGFLAMFNVPSSMEAMSAFARVVLWWYIPLLLIWTWLLGKGFQANQIWGWLGLTVVVMLTLAWGTAFQHAAREQSNLTADSASAISWITANVPGSDVIAAHPLSLGWHVMKQTENKVITTHPREAYLALEANAQKQDTYIRCVLQGDTCANLNEANPSWLLVRPVGIDIPANLTPTLIRGEVLLYKLRQ